MNSPLAELLDAAAPTVPDPADHLAYITTAFHEFVDAQRSAGAFIQPATLAPDRALTRGELDALRAVGFGGLNPKTHERAELARKEALHVFFQAYRTALTTREVAGLLDVNPSRIRQRVQERTLLILSDAGEMRFPAIQFEAGGCVPGLGPVLQALPADIKTLEAMSWLATPTVELEDDDGRARSPREFLLATGETAPVIELAKALHGEAA